MPRVGIGNVDAVEQNGELVFGAPVHTDVRLDAEASALPHIHASREFQQVVDGVGTRRLDVLSVNHLHEAHRLVGRQGGECAHHLGTIQRQFYLILLVVGRGRRLTEGHDGRSRIGACDSQCGDTQHTDAHLSHQTEEDGIAVSGEVCPHHRFGLSES